MPEVQRQVLAFVRNYPGAHVRAIERELRLSSRLASYHLELLEAAGQVQRIQETGYARFFPSVGAPRWSQEDLRFLCLMRRPAALRITVLLAREGGVTRRVLAERLGLARASISYHVGLLTDAGLVVTHRQGREQVYGLRDPAATLGRLANFTPLPDDLEPFDAMLADLVG